MICETYVQFFKSLSDPTRLDLIKSLKEKSKNVSELSKGLKLEQSRVSHNRRKLKELGFVNVEKKGKQRVYSLDEKTILPLLKLIDKHVDTYYKHYCKCKGKDKRKRWSNT